MATMPDSKIYVFEAEPRPFAQAFEKATGVRPLYTGMARWAYDPEEGNLIHVVCETLPLEKFKEIEKLLVSGIQNSLAFHFPGDGTDQFYIQRRILLTKAPAASSSPSAEFLLDALQEARKIAEIEMDKTTEAKQKLATAQIQIKDRQLAVDRYDKELAAANSSLQERNAKIGELQTKSDEHLRMYLEEKKLRQEMEQRLQAKHTDLQDMIKERDNLLEVLGAWHKTFGTSQLTHALARLEAAEDDRRRLLLGIERCMDKENDDLAVLTPVDDLNDLVTRILRLVPKEETDAAGTKKSDTDVTS